jgi:hypothetical protein
MTSTIPVSKNAIVTILKDLPENVLADIFWKSFVAEDPSPLSEKEKKSITRVKKEFKQGDTIKWQDIK